MNCMCRKNLSRHNNKHYKLFALLLIIRHFEHQSYKSIKVINSVDFYWNKHFPSSIQGHNDFFFFGEAKDTMIISQDFSLFISIKPIYHDKLSSFCSLHSFWIGSYLTVQPCETLWNILHNYQPAQNKNWSDAQLCMCMQIGKIFLSMDSKNKNV